MQNVQYIYIYIYIVATQTSCVYHNLWAQRTSNWNKMHLPIYWLNAVQQFFHSFWIIDPSSPGHSAMKPWNVIRWPSPCFSNRGLPTSLASPSTYGTQFRRAKQHWDVEGWEWLAQHFGTSELHSQKTRHMLWDGALHAECWSGYYYAPSYFDHQYTTVTTLLYSPPYWFYCGIAFL